MTHPSYVRLNIRSRREERISRKEKSVIITSAPISEVRQSLSLTISRSSIRDNSRGGRTGRNEETIGKSGDHVA